MSIAQAPTPTKSTRQLVSLALMLAAVGACLYVIGHEKALGGGWVLHYGIRIVTVTVALMAWFLTQAMIGSRALSDGRITDAVHALTADWHNYLEAHPEVANRVLKISSAVIDMIGIFMILWSVLGPSMRPFVAMLILFLMRQASQSTTALPAPPGVIWRNPGFPTILVTYHVGNDFFFSGHTSIAVLGAIEMWRISPWLGMLGALLAMGEIFVVLILRAHYTMDVLMAIAATWCAVSLTNWLFVIL